MNTPGENTAEELFEEFLKGGKEGVNPATLLERCRPEDRTRLASALVATENALKFHDSRPKASPEGIARLRARLNAAKRREDQEDESHRSGVPLAEIRLADAERRLAEMRARLSSEPFRVMADALNIVGLPDLQGGLYPNSVGVLRRTTAEQKSTKPKWVFDKTWLRGQEQRLREEAQRVLAAAKYERPPVDLHQVARSLSLLATEANLQDSAENATEGCLITDGNTGGILINTAVRLAQRRRFTFGHEVGHYVLHKTLGVFRDTAAELSDYATIQEMEANLFSSALLMPQEDLLRYATPSAMPTFDVAGEVAKIFDVSLQAALIRMIRDSDYACAFIASRAGRIQFMVGSPYWEGYLAKGEPLPPRSVAVELYKEMGQGSEPRTRVTPKAIWFDGKGDDTNDVMESSLLLNEERVYSILITK